MAHLIFYGLTYEATDPGWSILNASSLEVVYNYITVDSIIFVSKDSLEDKFLQKKLLLMKLASPYIQIFCVGGFAKYDSKHFIKIDQSEIREVIKMNTKRVYKLNSFSDLLKEITEEVLKEG